MGRSREMITNSLAMADNQKKVHPAAVCVEAPPPATPLVPHGSSMSEKGSPFRYQSPAPMQSHSIPKKGNCCCRFLCCIICFLFVFMVAIAAAAGILYIVFKPKVPNYSVDSLRITDFKLNFDLTLYAKFDVKITASNPNTKIGIYYEEGGHLSVWYTDTNLCQGSIPKFYQGHHNVTKLDVTLTGQPRVGSNLISALQQQQQTGQVPLDLKVDAPVSIELGSFKLRKVRVLGDCALVVDSLSANNKISIKASDCKFGLKL